MNLYVIKTDDGILHDTAFTTQALARAYLAKDKGLAYHPLYGWQDETGKTVARIAQLRLNVE